MKPNPELIEAIILIYTGAEIKNIIIRHEGYGGSDFERSGEYRVFNKTLKEKDILKFCRTAKMRQETAKQLKEFSWPEIRFIFLQYKTNADSYIKMKLRPVTHSGSGISTEWQAYGRNIPFFTFNVSADPEAFLKSFEQQLITFLG